MTLRVLWQMANGRRQRLRTLALDVATAMSLDSKKRYDFGRFIKTGALEERAVIDIPVTPLIQHYIDRINANGGHFKLEDN